MAGQYGAARRTSIGIGALAAERYQNLTALILAPRCSDRWNRQRTPLIRDVNARSVLHPTAAQSAFREAQTDTITTLSSHLCARLRPLLQDYLRSDERCEGAFDAFAYLLSLVYMDQVPDAVVQGRFLRGRFVWR